MSENMSPFGGPPGAESARPDSFDEADFRRKDFVGGMAVTMIDGNPWFFAEPKVRFAPADSDIGFQVIMSLDDDGEFNRLVERYLAIETMSPEDRAANSIAKVAVEIGLARLMLERNYELPIDVLRRILQIGVDEENDPADVDIRRSIARILMGDVPKPSAGGDVPSHTPPACYPFETAC